MRPFLLQNLKCINLRQIVTEYGLSSPTPPLWTSHGPQFKNPWPRISNNLNNNIIINCEQLTVDEVDSQLYRHLTDVIQPYWQYHSPCLCNPPISHTTITTRHHWQLKKEGIKDWNTSFNKVLNNSQSDPSDWRVSLLDQLSKAFCKFIISLATPEITAGMKKRFRNWLTI